MSRTSARGSRLVRTLGSAVVLCVACLVAAPQATAGPPFLTDDPVPVDYQHWELYAFSQGTQARGGHDGVLPAFEANYGIFPNAMVHVVLPVGAYNQTNGRTHWGYGDTELGFKFRFVAEESGGLRPAIGVFPIVVTPTGDQGKGLGGGHTRVFLPVWIQKTFGRWTTYGGGGYWTNPGAGNENYWFVGWLLQRQVTDRLALGAEVFHQTKDAVDGTDSSGFNVGGVYDFDEHHHLLFSVGRGIQHADETNRFSYYLGYQLTF